jgi:hypothetical protein
MRSCLPYFFLLAGKKAPSACRIAALDGDIVDEPRLAELCGGEKPDRSLAA